MTQKQLIKLAIDAKSNSYSPYSKFKVGAALISKKGNVYTGCNIENASFSATCCAERVAVFKAVSQGDTQFKTIVVATDAEEYSAPCGVCRQVLSEFSSDIKIILVNGKGKCIEESLKNLLPRPFNKF